eukprot:TRINITY_DN6614_c0_g4_i1.p4 TRINITY_DN6614_c0_g4~~TRINITY_DN6614_c0_g4_i1.p4  ORF type:complete len:118 (-),score=3.15 TRINITY_DN6614_c0_g4_i1:216-569(-)
MYFQTLRESDFFNIVETSKIVKLFLPRSTSFTVNARHKHKQVSKQKLKKTLYPNHCIQMYVKLKFFEQINIIICAHKNQRTQHATTQAAITQPTKQKILYVEAADNSLFSSFFAYLY